MIFGFLLILLGITYLLILLLRDKFGYLVPVSIILMTFFLYFSQILFGTFSVGIITISIIGAIGCLTCVVFAIRRAMTGKESVSLDNYFSPGFCTFLMAFFFAFLFYGGRHFCAWDECSHWGPMVKEMLRLDKFYCVPEAREMAHKDYPPLIQLFEYLTCRFMGGYSEGAVSFGIQLFLLSFLAPVFSEILNDEDGPERGKRFRRTAYLLLNGFFVLVTVILVFLCFDEFDVYKTIMTDCAASAIGAYGLILALDDRTYKSNSRKTCLLITAAFLPLSKQISIAFVLLIIFAYIIGLLQRKNKSTMVKDAVFCIPMIVLPILSLISWKLVISPYELDGQFDLAKLSLSGILNVLFGRGNWAQNLTYMKYLAALIGTPVTTGPLSMSYLTSCALAVLLLILLLKISYRERETDRRTNLLRYGLTFIAGMAGYAFTMLVMYMFCFVEAEMIALASFTRYMDTYVVVMYLILLALLFRYINGVTKIKAIPASGKMFLTASVTVVLLLFTGQERLTGFAPKVLGNELQKYQSISQEIDSFAEYNDNVLIVSENNSLYEPFIRYYCDDAIVSAKQYGSGIPEEELMKYDYVYFITVNENVESVWNSVLTGESGATLHAGMYVVQTGEEGCRVLSIY